MNIRKFIAIVGFIILIISISFFVVTDYSNSRDNSFQNCSNVSNVYGEPVTNNYSTSNSVTAKLTQVSNKTFRVKVRNPTRKSVQVQPSRFTRLNLTNKTIFQKKNGNFSTKKDTFTFKYTVTPNSASQGAPLLQKFDGDGYFLLPRIKPTPVYEISNGFQISERLAYTGKNTSMKIYRKDMGCHTVVYVAPNTRTTDKLFNELVESQPYLPYKNPHEYNYILTVDYNLSLDGRDVSGLSRGSLSYIELNATSLKPIGNLVYHEYIHNRIVAADTVSPSEDWWKEAITSYRETHTRYESGEITAEMERTILYKESKGSHNVSVHSDIHHAYTAGPVLLYTLENTYNIDVYELEKTCPSYSKDCFYTELKKKNPESMKFMDTETENFTKKVGNDYGRYIGWKQVIVYIAINKYTTISAIILMFFVSMHMIPYFSNSLFFLKEWRD